jgi:hypothetical protein
VIEGGAEQGRAKARARRDEARRDEASRPKFGVWSRDVGVVGERSRQERGELVVRDDEERASIVHRTISTATEV